ncbi:hypothetical protein TNIN_42011 [Trichonephila inaurata madagascariensis]|uniref:Uncharacterized protein n=1 Tax=Trichonephila inaurata madagascariensis TaxID=2747483 RepID=A0A8X6X6Y9_9ARAC|nr:hypothetical protein TNIN_468381 [Trichonephila inaurata madagascariensis]GFY74077.1 hypothetical protein TNIN_42011 [Trichonephila inaurata madagascariensis]
MGRLRTSWMINTSLAKSEVRRGLSPNNQFWGLRFRTIPVFCKIPFLKVFGFLLHKTSTSAVSKGYRVESSENWLPLSVTGGIKSLQQWSG